MQIGLEHAFVLLNHHIFVWIDAHCLQVLASGESVGVTLCRGMQHLVWRLTMQHPEHVGVVSDWDGKTIRLPYLQYQTISSCCQGSDLLLFKFPLIESSIKHCDQFSPGSLCISVCVCAPCFLHLLFLHSSSPPRPLLLFRWQFTATQKMSSSGFPCHCTLSCSCQWSVTRNAPTISPIKLLTGPILMWWQTSSRPVKDAGCLWL